jgi:sugar transferase (PEP-CTERM/EpsH1 system associated)
MKIRILHVIQTLEPGGLENGIVNLVNSMDPEQFEIHLYCVRAGGEFQSLIRNENTKVIIRQCPKQRLKIALEIRSWCKRLKIDIAHTHGWGTFFVGVLGAKLARVPIIINGEHGVIYDNYLRQRLIQWLLYNSVDLNLTVSQSLKQTICQQFWVNPSRVHPILNGVDTGKFFSCEDVRRLKRRDLGINTDTFIVGTVGRLVAVKDYPTLINAFSVLRSAEPQKPAKLLFVGNGEEQPALEELIRHLKLDGDVMFLGHRNDIVDLLNAMDVFVLTSKTEGLSNAILEAMACGKPVIATQVGGNPEIVKHQKTGFLFTVGDWKGLSSELIRLIRDLSLCQSYAANATVAIHQELSLSRMIENYQDLYLQLAKSRVGI